MIPITSLVPRGVFDFRRGSIAQEICLRRAKRKNIYNFDDMRVRVGCPKGVEILVPADVKEVITRT